MNDITIAMYGLNPSRATVSGVDQWELTLYASSLPSAPARALVTAAGAGREVRRLHQLGYEVDAFEPASDQARHIEALKVDLVLRATHDDLARAVRGDANGPAAELAGRTYDAVILGWGSFTHVLERRPQLDLLAACDRLCPQGPILMSFWAAGAAPRRGRAYAAGQFVGRCLALVRRRSPRESGVVGVAEDIGFAFHLGFTRRFALADIESLAVVAHREGPPISGWSHATRGVDARIPRARRPRALLRTATRQRIPRQ